MSGLGRPEQAAIAHVARRFAATCDAADGGWPDAWLTIAGRRIAVEVAVISPGLGERSKPRLRFDRVVLGLLRRLRASLSALVRTARPSY